MLIAALLAGADLHEVTEDELRDWVTSRLRNHADEFPKLVERLRQLALQTDPVQLLALLSVRLLRPRVADPEIDELFPIIQPHIEFLQALILQRPQEDYAWGNPRTPLYLDEIESTLKRLGFLFMTKQWAQDAEGHSSAIAGAVQRTRGHTQFTRNWGYPEQIERIVSGVFAAFEERTFAATGVRIADLVAMNHQIMDIGESRIRSLVETFGRILSAPTKQQALTAAKEAAPDLLTAAFSQRILSPLYSLQDATGELLEKLSHEPGFNLTFTVRQFAGGYPRPVNADALKRTLRGWSKGFGDLGAKDPEFFFLDNPVWAHPLIALTEDLYFLPILPLLNTWCLELMERVIAPHPKLWKAYRETHRGKFLEAETERLFRNAFPEAEIHPNVSARDPDTGALYESDLLVLLGSGAMFVEAKADKLGDKARRGAEHSLTDDVHDLVGYPAIQANRFRELVLRHPGPLALRTGNGEQVTIDGSTLKWTGTLAVTLEWNFIHRGRWLELRQEGLVPAEQSPIPVISVADLECALLVLRSPCERLHYLRKRADVETVPGYSGSELDLLAFYLDAGFDDRAAASQPWPGGLDGRFKEIDPALSDWFSRRSTKLPRRRLGKGWAQLIQWLEKERPENWLEIGTALLDVTFSEQERLGREWNRQADIVRAPRRRLDHEFLVHAINSPAVRCNLVLMSHKSIPKVAQDQLLSETARSVAVTAGVPSVIVISRNVGRPGLQIGGALLITVDSQTTQNG